MERRSYRSEAEFTCLLARGVRVASVGTHRMAQNQSGGEDYTGRQGILGTSHRLACRIGHCPILCDSTDAPFRWMLREPVADNGTYPACGKFLRSFIETIMQYVIGRRKHKDSRGKYKCTYDYLHPHTDLLLMRSWNSHSSMLARDGLDDFFCQGRNQLRITLTARVILRPKYGATLSPILS